MSSLLKSPRNLVKIFSNGMRTTASRKAPTLDELIKVKPLNEIAKYSKPGSIYDPPYLNQTVSFPSYPTLNINFYSYDYITIDAYYKYVRKLCGLLNIDVAEAYPMPARSLAIKTYKPYSMIVDTEFNLKRYHRCVRVDGMKSTLAPILYEAIQMNLPEGVTLEIHEPNPDHDQFRYVPDVQIDVLKDQIKDIESGSSI